MVDPISSGSQVTFTKATPSAAQPQNTAASSSTGGIPGHNVGAGAASGDNPDTAKVARVRIGAPRTAPPPAPAFQTGAPRTAPPPASALKIGAHKTAPAPGFKIGKPSTASPPASALKIGERRTAPAPGEVRLTGRVSDAGKAEKKKLEKQKEPMQRLLDIVNAENKRKEEDAERRQALEAASPRGIT